MKSRKYSAVFLALALALPLAAGASPAQAGSITITDFTKNGTLPPDSKYPTGTFTANNSFKTTFDITSDASGNNVANLAGTSTATTSSYTVNVGQSGVTDVYTLMNVGRPPAGTAATVTFYGSGGATESFTLTNGTNTRDWSLNGYYADSINGTTTQNAFYDQYGPYNAPAVLDEQHFALSSAFANQKLDHFTYTYSNDGNNNVPFLAAVTVNTAATPEPASLTLLGLGGLGLAGYGWRRRKATAAA